MQLPDHRCAGKNYRACACVDWPVAVDVVAMVVGVAEISDRLVCACLYCRQQRIGTAGHVGIEQQDLVAESDPSVIAHQTADRAGRTGARSLLKIMRGIAKEENPRRQSFSSPDHLLAGERWRVDSTAVRESFAFQQAGFGHGVGLRPESMIREHNADNSAASASRATLP
jgi:hypothetical protein